MTLTIYVGAVSGRIFCDISQKGTFSSSSGGKQTFRIGLGGFLSSLGRILPQLLPKTRIDDRYSSTDIPQRSLRGLSSGPELPSEVSKAFSNSLIVLHHINPFIRWDWTTSHGSDASKFWKPLRSRRVSITPYICMTPFDVQRSHLCFLSLDEAVSWFRRSTPNKALKPYIVKNISQVLEALVQLHNLNIFIQDN